MTSERARGFTLLEMLVVLMIAGMTMLLTTQAVGQYQRAHTRAIASERIGREQRMSIDWFRASVRGLQWVDTGAAGNVIRFGEADPAMTPFTGDQDGFTATTLAPVLGRQGIPVAQRWEVARAPGAATLHLQEGGQDLALSLPPAGDLRFFYLDPEGELHEQWPPRLGTARQLPAAVVLELDPMPGADASEGRTLVAAVMGAHDPFYLPYEFDPL